MVAQLYKVLKLIELCTLHRWMLWHKLYLKKAVLKNSIS